jgi:hypothetical protein
MRDSNRHFSILGLMGLVALAAVMILALQWLSENWVWNGLLQAILLTPVLLLYAFSWTILVLLAPALVAVAPGIPAAEVVKWVLAVLLGSTECLCIIVWTDSDSIFILTGLGFLVSSVWVGSSMALREYIDRN